MLIIFLIHLSATSIMTGVIWVIQLLHYPFFHHLYRPKFSHYMQEHRYRISLIVIPVMLMELFTGIYLLYYSVSLQGLFIIGCLMLAAIWISTFKLQMRAHKQIVAIYNQSAVNRLVKTNWIRTILWTARLILLFIISVFYSIEGTF